MGRWYNPNTKVNKCIIKKKKKKVNKFTSYVKWHSYSVRMKDVPPQIADILLANFGWFQVFNVEADFSKKKSGTPIQ